MKPFNYMGHKMHISSKESDKQAESKDKNYVVDCVLENPSDICDVEEQLHLKEPTKDELRFMDSLSEQIDTDSSDAKIDDKPVSNDERNDYTESVINSFSNNPDNVSDTDAKRYVPNHVSDNHRVSHNISESKHKEPDEMNVEHEQTDQNKSRNPVSKVRTKSFKSDDDIPMSCIKKFPSEMAKTLKSFFPDANTMDEAVAAYVYLKEIESDNEFEVPERIKDVAESYNGTCISMQDIKTDMHDELQSLKNQNRQLMKKIDAIELALTYLLSDRLGFVEGNKSDISDINFLETTCVEMMHNVEKQSQLHQMREKQREGTPYR